MTRAHITTPVILLSLLMGCGWWSDTPSDRARHFIERQVAAETPATDPVGDLAARVALDYARALVRQGARLRYRVEKTIATVDQTTALITVTPDPRAGTAPANALRFSVVVARDGAGEWRVTQWSAE